MSPMFFDPLKDYPGYALRRASNAWIAVLTSRLQTLELKVSEATVLLAISHNPNIKQSDICRLLDIASANIAPLIRRLDQRCLVERIPVDGRSQGLKLTKNGSALAQEIMVIVEGHEQKIMDRIPEELRHSFMDALSCLWVSESK